MFHHYPCAAGILLLVLTAGCGSVVPSFYTVPVRQGNYVDPAMAGQLRPGMTRQQVQQLLGAPLIADPFHQDRWDYYYQYSKGGRTIEQRHLILHFRGDTLDRVDGVVD